MTSPVIFGKSYEAAQRWINELMEELGNDDPQVAYRVLRGTLHALRDRLQPEEAVDLGAQLSTLIRGIYYEGWNPAATPVRLRTREAFLDRVGRELVPSRDPEPEEAARAVFKVLAFHVTAGEIDDVLGMLPEPLRELWPPAPEHRTTAASMLR